MEIKKGSKVKVNYTGMLEDGTIFDSSKRGEEEQPLEFEVGSGKIIKGFDNAVMGMKKGDKKKITLKPEEAYGDIKEELIKPFPRDMMPKEKEPQPGMMLMVGAPNGMQFPAKIVEVSDSEVKIDLNHPLAGKTLVFELEIVDIE